MECEEINTEIPVPRQFICKCFDLTSVGNMLTVVGFPSGYLDVHLDVCIKRVGGNLKHEKILEILPTKCFMQQLVLY